MYVEGVRDRIEEIKEKVGVKESDLEYPTLPPGLEQETLKNQKKRIDSKLPIENQTDLVIEDIRVI